MRKQDNSTSPTRAFETMDFRDPLKVQRYQTQMQYNTNQANIGHLERRGDEESLRQADHLRRQNDILQHQLKL